MMQKEMPVLSQAARPHLVFIIHSLGGGGAERTLVDLGAWWVQSGCRVTVMTQADAATDVYALHPEVERVVLGTAGVSGGGLRGLLANLRRVWRIRRWLRRHEPQVVIGMMTTSSILAVLAARGLPCRVIATEHTHPPVQRLPEVWQRLRRWAYPRAWAVVALTAGTAQWLREHVPGARVEVIPNAVSWPLASQDPVLVPPDRGGRHRLLAVGRLHPVKGFDHLIAAFATLAGRFPDWDLYIVGEGAERAALQAAIEEMGLTDRVFLPGRAGNIAQWYADSDVYVLSSRSEGLSNTLLEAMAAGLPAVAVDCDTGPREIIRDGIDGVLVNPPDDPEALAAYLSDLMAHPWRRMLLARRAVDVRDRFSSARIMAMWAKVLG